MCRDWGEGDWKIHFPPSSEDCESSAAAFADALLESAHDPVAAISPPPPYQARGRALTLPLYGEGTLMLR